MLIYRGIIQLVTDTAVAHRQQLTLIFPTSCRPGEPVYFCWTWSRGEDQGEKRTEQHPGILNKVVPTDEGWELGFTCPGKYQLYQFEAIASAATESRPPFPSLKLWARGADADEDTHSRRAPHTLLLDFQSSNSSHWCFYVGKLQLNAEDADHDSVDKEAILIGMPNTMAVDDPVCVYWQWTTREDGSKDSIENVHGKITKSGYEGDKFKIGLSGSNAAHQSPQYTFGGTCSGDGSALALVMTETSGGTKSAEFTAREAQPTSPGRGKRDIFSDWSFQRTALVENDTDETVVISLVESGNSSTSKGRVLAAAGAALTFLGGPWWSIPVGLSTSIFIASAKFAGITTVDTYLNPDRAVEDFVLLPGHSVYRNSSGIWGNSNAQILQCETKQKSLTMYSWMRADLGNKDWKLSDLADKVERKPILEIRLDSDKRLQYRALVTLEGFKPAVSTSDDCSSDNLLDLPVSTMLTADAQGNTAKVHGTWTDNSVKLSWDNSKRFSFIQPAASSSVARTVSLYKTGRHVLRLRGYKVTGAVFDFEVDSETRDAEDGVLRKLGWLARRVSMFPRICSWEVGKKICRHTFGGGLALERAASDRFFVYLLVDHVLPFQKMV